jgi:uncharacterized damage-inducible protein DinB
MLLTTITTIFERDLKKLHTEIELYQQEENLWATDKKINNSAGNLCMHLTGNLNTYIGKELGNTGYVRNRELEFSQKNVPRAQLLEMITDTSKMLHTVLQSLSAADLEKEYPVIVFTEKMTTGFFLVHLASHLAYHLGQVNYHRRLLDK